MRTVEDLKVENNDLRDQLATSHDSIGKLEDLMHTNKERDFQNKMANQEAESELNLLKDRLNLNENKLYVVFPFPENLHLIFFLFFS